MVGILAGAVGGLAWGGWRALQDPRLEAAAFTPADGARAQQKLLDLVHRPRSRGSGGPVVLSEQEVHALLAPRIADLADLPLREASAALVGDTLEVRGRLPLAVLLGEPPFAGLATLLPQAWLSRLLWLRVRTGVRIERVDTPRGRRFVRFDPTYVAIGRQRVPALLYRLLLPPSGVQLLRWPAPASVEDVRIEPGRVVIRTTS